MRLWTCCIILLLVLCVVAAHADIFELVLSPEWLGHYNACACCEAQIDFGQTFTAIESLSIVWAGYIEPGRYEDDVVMGLFRISARESGSTVAHASTGWMAGAGHRQDFSLQTHLSPLDTWNFLLDGTTYLRITFENDIEFEEAPYGYLGSAKLVVNATPVPEPSGFVALLCATGVLGATFRRKR